MSLLTVALLFGLSFAQDQSSFFPWGFTSDNTVSSTCSNALTSNFGCSSYFLFKVNDDDTGPFDNDTAVDQFCSDSCGSSLASYVSAVETACQGDPQPWKGIPAVHPGARLAAYRERTCLKDPATDAYCNDVIASWNVSLSDEQTFDQMPVQYLCSSCFMAKLQAVQSTAYSNYDSGFVEPYKNAQSICGVNHPTDVQPWPFNATNNTPAGTNSTTGGDSFSCLSGNYYTVASGDNCNAISQAASVGIGALRIINGIYPDCSNLIAGASICLPPKCRTYTIQSGDTCFSIAKKQATSITSLKSFNPTLNNACSNLIAGENICLEPAAGNYTPTLIAGATSTESGSYATSSASAPGPTPFGTTERCGKYYQVVAGDNCGQISINNTITVELFQAINPSIDERCSNLVPDLYYCIRPMASWNETTGNTSASVTQAPPAPTGEGTTGSCYKWHSVKSGDSCSLLQSTYGITFAQLRSWNAALNETCGNLVLDQAYCVRGPSATSGSGSSTPTSSTISTPTPTQNGMVAGCKKFYQAKSGDYCYLIYTDHGISQADFMAWNTGVGSDCTQIYPDYWYCIRV